MLCSGLVWSDLPRRLTVYEEEKRGEGTSERAREAFGFGAF